MELKKESLIETRYSEVTPKFVIENFLLALTLQNHSFSKKVLEDFFLFHGKNVNRLSHSDFEEYLNYINRIQQYRQTPLSTLQKKTTLLVKFINFLNERKIIHFQVQPHILPLFCSSTKLKEKERKTNENYKKDEKEIEEAIRKYLHFLKNNDYYSINYYKKRIIAFSKFMNNRETEINTFLEKNKEDLLISEIRAYEIMLSKRVVQKEIQKSTATTLLRAVKLFVKFLKSESLVSHEYTIPLHLRGRSTRDNSYVVKDMIIKMMNAIYDNSKNLLRDLAVFLSIVDTGCRPVEIVNCSLSDLDLVENTLILQCGKTKPRKVKISKEVIEVIKDYLKIRDKYGPINDSLFITTRGRTISSSTINIIFYHANLNAFGEARYPARAFRHTYITNGLEHYSFEKVSKAIGHEDWRSTFYYLNRSKKRLLKNTIDHSPLSKERGN